MMADCSMECAWSAKKGEEIRYLRQMGDRARARSVAKTARQQQPRTTDGDSDRNWMIKWAGVVVAGTYVAKVYISVAWTAAKRGAAIETRKYFWRENRECRYLRIVEARENRE